MPLESTTPKPIPLPSSRIEHEPTTPQLNGRNRRHHSRRSTMSRRESSRTSPSSEMRRTQVALDHDSFSYDSKYLKDWTINPELLEVVPDHIRKAIEALQLAGAAVATDIERVSDHYTNLLEAEDSQEKDARLEEHHEAKTLALRLADVKARTERLHSGQNTDPDHENEQDRERPIADLDDSVADLAKLIINTSRADSVVASSPSVHSARDTTRESSYIGSGGSSPVTPLTPLPCSPISSLVLGSDPITPHTQSSHPLRPTESLSRGTSGSQVPIIYYLREVEHLKSESLVRLRHSTMHIDKELRCAASIDGKISAWWVEFKAKADECYKRGIDLCDGL